jgi:polyhydroxyalkanoate synthesis repressor PhaR
VIKRYENRKLYDTEGKRYVRLADIAALIRGGEVIAVIDNVTGEDQTAQTLIKVIAEDDVPKRSIPPVEALHQLVREGAQSVSSGLSQLQQLIDRAVRKALEHRSPVRELQEEVARLQGRLKSLETSIQDLQMEVDDERNSGNG